MDRWTLDGQTDGQMEKKCCSGRGSHVASLVKSRPVTQEEIAWRMEGVVHNIPIALLKKCGDEKKNKKKNVFCVLLYIQK